jgi:CRP-like cAMP-binding protein/ActR/RegA family two-component response regulator
MPPGTHTTFSHLTESKVKTNQFSNLDSFMQTVVQNKTQKILLIEDNQEMADNITSILQLANYDVMYAPNGKQGVSLAQKSQPDLILCDIMMPELDGYGVLHILNHDPETASIPFVFLTAKVDKNEIREGMNLGADDYITKPFDSTDLLKVIEIRLKKKETLKSSYSNNDFNLNTLFSETKELKELEKLYSNRPVRTYRKKEFLFMEGQTPTDLYFIRKGEIKTYKVNYDGKELITGIHNNGDFVGYVSLLEERPYNENAEVLEEAEIMMIPRQEFLNLVYCSKDMARKFIRLVSSHLVEAENRLLNLAYQSVRQRVADALLKLNHQMQNFHKTAIIAICRKDISNIVGTATESLNRTLADFKDEGLIEITEDGIKILNQPKLERLLH